jgi:hypothetical protein
MNLFGLLGDGAALHVSPGEKMTETLPHALRAMMQFSVIFFSGDTPSLNIKMNSFLKSRYMPLLIYIQIYS